MTDYKALCKHVPVRLVGYRCPVTMAEWHVCARCGVTYYIDKRVAENAN